MGKRRKRSKSVEEVDNEESELFASEFDSDDQYNEEELNDQEEALDEALVDTTEEESFITGEIPDASVDVKELEEDSESLESQKTSEYLELSESDESVVVYNSKEIFKNKIIYLDDLEVMVKLKVPPGERFIIILLNPFEMLSAHIEGSEASDNLFRSFKLPLKPIKGQWVLKIQFLELQIGETTQYTLTIK